MIGILGDIVLLIGAINQVLLSLQVRHLRKASMMQGPQSWDIGLLRKQ